MIIVDRRYCKKSIFIRIYDSLHMRIILTVFKMPITSVGMNFFFNLFGTQIFKFLPVQDVEIDNEWLVLLYVTFLHTHAKLLDDLIRLKP